MSEQASLDAFGGALRRRDFITLFGASVLMATPTSSWAQEYPSGPIKIIVPFGPGTTSDLLARVLASRLQSPLKQPVIVENVTGAGGLIGTKRMVHAAKDGLTLALVNNAHVINPSIYKDASFDAIADIAPIAVIGQTPLVLTVRLNLPAKNLTELIALAKANPGGLSYGSSGNGGVLHLAGVLFTSEAGIDVKHIPYKQSGQIITDLISGFIDMAFPASLTAAPQVASGTLRALAVTSRTRSALLPDVPPMAESGLPQYDFGGWLGLVAPAGTPVPIVERLNSELRTILTKKDMQDELVKMDITPMDHSIPFATDFFKDELAKHTRLVKASGATFE